ncbi:MAG: DUF4091 domain-containing protein [Clostridia bacterium]|nr:DUF4091 domain-containing protein [Clostridia bacterium]
MKIEFAYADRDFKQIEGKIPELDCRFIKGAEKIGDIRLFSVKNSSAAFQIAVRADEDCILNVGTEPYFSQRGQKPTVRIALDSDLTGTLNILDLTLTETGLRYADALLSSPILELKAGEVRTVYAELRVPPDADPGNHSFTVSFYTHRMLEAETKAGSFSGTVEVSDYVLHDVKENKFHLDLWQHPSNLARKAETPLWSDAHFAVIERYLKSLGELGQKAVTIIASDAPWSGQGCGVAPEDANMFEYGIIQAKKTRDGRIECDFRAMQRYIDTAAKYGIDREISVYGLCNVWSQCGFTQPAEDYPDGVRIRYLDEADGCYRYMTSAEDIKAYIVNLEQYFLATGQMDRVRLSADEPGDIGHYRTILGLLHEIAPAFKFKACINHSEFIGEFGEEVYDFAPYIGGMTAEYQVLKRYQATMPGKRFLYYICCGPAFPNTFITSPLIESEYMPVLASAAGFDGMLRWSYNIWPDRPREDSRYRDWRTGDTHLVYPQADGSPLLTLRWKEFKRGIELYEILEELKAKDSEAAAEAYAMVMKTADIEAVGKAASPEEMYVSDIEAYDGMEKFAAEKLAE